MNDALSVSVDLWRDDEATARFYKGRVALYALLKAAGCSS